MDALRKAIEIAGTQAALAGLLGLRQSHIAMWLHRKNVPAEHCPDIERVTNGAVRCEDLRPDVHWAVLREQSAPQDTARVEQAAA
jgi:DNA-binding transcriptional regulator YdaS (Cro superfamily)